MSGYIEAVRVTSEYPQDGISDCCYFNYRVDMQLQNCMVRCILRPIGCVMSEVCHAEQEYPQDGGCDKKADVLY